MKQCLSPLLSLALLSLAPLCQGCTHIRTMAGPLLDDAASLDLGHLQVHAGILVGETIVNTVIPPRLIGGGGANDGVVSQLLDS